MVETRARRQQRDAHGCIRRWIRVGQLFRETHRAGFSLRAIYSVAHAAEHHPWPPAATLRTWRRSRDDDGKRSHRHPDLRPETTRSQSLKTARRNADDREATPVDAHTPSDDGRVSR